MQLLASSNPLIKVIPGLMVWTIVAFGITFYILKKFAFGPIQNMIDQRREQIRASVEEADRVRDEARGLLEEHKALIGQARSDAENILTEARRISDAQQQRMRDETEEDRKRRLEETERQIDVATQQALAQLKQAVAELSLEVAQKVTVNALTDKDQKRLIDEALAEIDFSQLEASRS